MNVSARQLVPLLLAAFVVGGLFRLYNITGIGFYRMFGTFGIVIMGWLGTRIVQSWQLEDASAGMQEVLQALPEGWRALERGAPIGLLGWQGYIVGQEETLAVTTMTTANYVRGARLRGQLRRGVTRALALTEVAPPEHVVFPVTPCVVLLRRRADEEVRESEPEDVLFFDVDGFARYFTEPKGAGTDETAAAKATGEVPTEAAQTEAAGGPPDGPSHGPEQD